MNPFNYQGPVAPQQLINRRAELESLQRAERIVSLLLAAARRFGKSSLLDSHVASMRPVGHRAVRIDLSNVGTVGDVAARVGEAFTALPTDPRRSVRRWAARLGVTAKIAGVELSLVPGATEVTVHWDSFVRGAVGWLPRKPAWLAQEYWERAVLGPIPARRAPRLLWRGPRTARR